ncbi:aldo/keto reductase [Clostridium estertheticum]|uniref:aldo/keto reductase n=1 Tax=Clostridium estertheticum TaxID=238834 RepID=UPI001C0CC76A|nr:aldo/keto reductase [Clostridium estertheticum]MBU3202356.1 aldo/keto reductase [Clostridium estertheticum]WAG67968.1 aldo/keto reductase [Clostridium estertheticum]
MKERILGNKNNGLKVSSIGLGCMGITYGHGPAMDTNDADALIHKAVDLGITLFDTAEFYDDNEKVIGKALKPYRNRVNIVTKCGIRHGKNGEEVLDARPEIIRESAEQSLKRLGTDTIDLYYLHRVDPKVPIEEVAGAMQKLIEQGKIRHWGLSEASVGIIRRAHAVCPLTAVESEYSMIWREPEKELFPVLDELKIGFMPFSPLAKGFLTGMINRNTTFAFSDARNNFPRFSKENIEANQSVVDLIKNVAAAKDATPAQISLAWIFAQKPWIVPIPETRKQERLYENIGSANIELSTQELSDLNAALAKIEIFGNRYATDSVAAKSVEK